MRLGIASRFGLIFSMLVLLATGTVGYMVYQGARTSLLTATNERFVYTARTVQVRLAASTEAISKDLRLIAATPPVDGIVRARTRRGLDPYYSIRDDEWRNFLSDFFYAFLKNRPSYRRVRFAEIYNDGRELVRVDRRGERLVRVPTRALGPVDSASVLYQAVRLAPEGVYLTRLQSPSAADTLPLMRAAAPVFTAAGKPFGAVEVEVDFTEVLRAAVGVADPNEHLYLLNDRAELLYASPQADLRPGDQQQLLAQMQGHPLLRSFLEGTQKELRLYQKPGDPSSAVKAVLRPITIGTAANPTRLVLMIVPQYANILDDTQTVRDRSILITFLFSLAGMILAAGFSGFLTRPLSQVTRAISEFGKGSRSVNLHLRRRDEIGVLARTFQEMMTKIESQVSELEDKERRQRIILEASGDGIIVADHEGRIETFNRAAEQLFAYSAEEAAGIPFGAFLQESRHYGLDPDAVDWHAARAGVELHGLRKDGSSFPVAVSVSMFELAGEQKYAVFVQDITERKEYEEALRSAKEQAEEMARLKSAFLANMSHEIRTPLTSVIGYASLLSREVGDKHRKFTQLIERSGKRLMDTLNAVLSLAQLETGRAQVKLMEIDVAAEVEEIVQIYEPMMQEKNLSLSVEVAPEAVGARARLDAGALSSIMQNLIGNAVKFTQHGGIAVRVMRQGPDVCVQVRDTGVGIDPGFLPHIFDEFRQESTGLGRSHEGSGLGLAITRRLVELMGGAIHAESAKGAGSTFTIRFADVAPHEVSPTPAAPAAPPDLRGAQVLLVEDNAETAFLMLHLLLDYCEVALAANGEEAVRKASVKSFDAIFLDINLGQGDSGIDVVRRIRKLPGYADTPIAAITAYALPGDREGFLEEGFDEYLSKPFTAEGLMDLTRRLFKRRAVRSRSMGDGSAPA